MNNEIVVANSTKEYVGNLWDKQAWETEKEHDFFIAYANMMKRSHGNIPGVTSPMNHDGTVNNNPMSKNYISNISVKNNWIERCNAFDTQRSNEFALVVAGFKDKGLNDEIDTYNKLFSMYLKILENKSNKTVTEKELNYLVTLGLKIDDYFRRIVALPDRYHSGVIETNSNNTNTTVRRIEIVEVSRPANNDYVLSSSEAVIEGTITE